MIQAVSAVSREAGILHVCDSTMATPLMVKPLQLGADITLQASAFEEVEIQAHPTLLGAVDGRQDNKNEILQCFHLGSGFYVLGIHGASSGGGRCL